LKKIYKQILIQRLKIIKYKIKGIGVNIFSKFIGENPSIVSQKINGHSVMNDIVATYYEYKIEEFHND